MSSQNCERLKQVNDFKYLGSYIASTEHDINGKAWSALNQLTNISKSRLSKKLEEKLLQSNS